MAQERWQLSNVGATIMSNAEEVIVSGVRAMTIEQCMSSDNRASPVRLQ